MHRSDGYLTRSGQPDQKRSGIGRKAETGKAGGEIGTKPLIVDGHGPGGMNIPDAFRRPIKYSTSIRTCSCLYGCLQFISPIEMQSGTFDGLSKVSQFKAQIP